MNPRNLLALKRCLPAQKQIGDAAKRPNIDFIIVDVPFDQLRSHVERWPENKGHAFLALELLRKTEIYELKLEILLACRDEH